MKRSASMRPLSVSGRPSRCTTGCGLTPAVHTTVRAGTTSPVDSVTLRSVTCSTVCPMRNSMPRPRSSRTVKSDSFGGTSIIGRSAASTSIQRMPWTRQRG